MPTPEELFRLYEGRIVPRSFHYGFILVSYAVSFIGAASTLELINRRTSPKGKYNHFLLFSAAVSMGGIAIWCMHFIGNRAIDLADREPELQISYSSGFTALSFFVPIAVLMTAFLATGTNDSVSWWRICVGGFLAGNAICGMHYLGNASIKNYKCEYELANIVGAAIIACVASVVALAVFFVFRATWNASWWKRALCAILLAGAVSGMHWCPSVGTQYRLISLNDDKHLSRNTTVIVVILLSVAACIVMAGTAIYTAHIKRRYAAKAQQVILASAVFDKQGRILVNANGMIPSEVITDTFLEKSAGEPFNVAHPLFHWMFQASRSWSGIANILSGMTNHLDSLPKHGSNSKTAVRLINEHGDLIDNYDLVFRELFCCAASSLAEKLKEHLSQVGVLWDEILSTGASPRTRAQQPKSALQADGRLGPAESQAEKGMGGQRELFTNGSLMFLVKKVDTRHVEKFEAMGYRFADIRQVSPIIRSRMQIRGSRLEEKLGSMSNYVNDHSMSERGVHVGFFGIRARVGGYGFDVLVRKGARNLLPSIPLPMEKLEGWQKEFIQHLEGVQVSSLPKRLEVMKQKGGQEKQFATQLMDAVDSLAAFVGDPLFDDACVTARTVDVPCQSEGGVAKTCPMVVLRLVVPIHVHVTSTRTEFIPLSFFKIRQLMYKDSPYHAVFTRSVHREVSPIINSVPFNRRSSNHNGKSISIRTALASKLGRGKSATVKDAEGNPIPTVLGRKRSADSQQSGSTIRLWEQKGSDDRPLREPSDTESKDDESTQQPAPTSFGGIMMTQEVTVHVGEAVSPTTPTSPDTRQSPSSESRKLGHVHKLSGSGLLGRRGSEHPGSPASPRDRKGSGGVIEMRPIPGMRSIGGGMTAAVEAEGENMNDVTTFVDELFTMCIDGHSR